MAKNVYTVIELEQIHVTTNAHRTERNEKTHRRK